jgi:hypothetical protein
MEDDHALHTPIMVADILEWDIGVVMVLPKRRAKHSQLQCNAAA